MLLVACATMQYRMMCSKGGDGVRVLRENDLVFFSFSSFFLSGFRVFGDLLFVVGLVLLPLL